LPNIIKETKECTVIDRFLIPTTMWNIIKSAAIRKVKNEDTHLLQIDRNTTNNYQVISDASSHYICQLLKRNSININNSVPICYLL
jgi:hypothetical protein